MTGRGRLLAGAAPVAVAVILALAAAGDAAAQVAGPSVVAVTVSQAGGLSSVAIEFDEAIASPGMFGVENAVGAVDADGDRVTAVTATLTHGTGEDADTVTLALNARLPEDGSADILVPSVTSASSPARTSPAETVRAFNYQKPPGILKASFTSESTITVDFEQVMRASTLDSDPDTAGLQAHVRVGDPRVSRHLPAEFDGESTLRIEIPEPVPLGTAHIVVYQISTQNYNGVAFTERTTSSAVSPIATAGYGDDALTLEVTFAEAVSASTVPSTIKVRPDGGRTLDAPVMPLGTATSATSITLLLGSRVPTPASYTVDLPASIGYADGSPDFGGGVVHATFPGLRFETATRSTTDIRVTFLEPVRLADPAHILDPSEWRVNISPRSPGELLTPAAVSSLAADSFTLTMPSSTNGGNGLLRGVEPAVRYFPPAGPPAPASPIVGEGGRGLIRNTVSVAAYAVPPALFAIERISPEITRVVFTQVVGGTTGVDDWAVTDTTRNAMTDLDVATGLPVIGVGTGGADTMAVPEICMDTDDSMDTRTGPNCELVLHKAGQPTEATEEIVGAITLRHASVANRGLSTPDSVEVVYTGRDLYGIAGSRILRTDDGRVPAGSVSRTFDVGLAPRTATETTTVVRLVNPDGSSTDFFGLIDVGHWSVTPREGTALVPTSISFMSGGSEITATAGMPREIPPASPAGSLTLTHGDIGSTSAAPTITYTRPSGDRADNAPTLLSSAAARRVADTVTAVAEDGIDPRLDSARTASATSLTVTLTEAVMGTTAAAQWSVTGATNLAVSSPGSATTRTLTLRYDAGSASATPTVTYTRPDSGGLVDLGGNMLAGGMVDATDSVAPSVASARTTSTTTLTVTLSESVTGTTAPGEWSALDTRDAGEDLSASISSAMVSGNTVTLTYDEILDTSFAPRVTYAAPDSGPLADAAGNELSGSAVAADGQRPVARSASFVDSRTIDVTFSEPVSLAGTWTASPSLGTLTASQGSAYGAVRLSLTDDSDTTDALPGAYTLNVPPEVADMASPPNAVAPDHTVMATYTSPFTATTRGLTETLVDFGGAALTGTLDIDDWTVTDDDPDGPGGTPPPRREVVSVAALNAAGAAVATATRADRGAGTFETVATVPAGTHTRLLITHDGLAGSGSTPVITHSTDRPATARPGGLLSAGGTVLRETPVEASDGIAPYVLSAETASDTTVTVTLSEGVTGATAAAEWIVNMAMASSVAAGAQSASGATALAISSADELVLTTPAALPGGATPEVSYMAPTGPGANSLADAADNAMASTPRDSPVTASDGVMPVPLSASFVAPQLIDVTFSEPVRGGGTWAVAPALGTITASEGPAPEVIRLATQSAAGAAQYTITVPAAITDRADPPNPVDLPDPPTLGATYAAPAAPAIVSAKTTSLTTTVVTFNQSLDTGTLGASDWTVTGASALPVTSVRLGEHAAAAASPQASITLDPSTVARAITLVHDPLAHTGVTPGVAYLDSGTLGRSDATPMRVAARAVEATDATPPTFRARWGGIDLSDTIIVTFSDPVSQAEGKGLPEPYANPLAAAGDWTVTGRGMFGEVRVPVEGIDYALGSRQLARGAAPPELLAATYLSDTQV
ncbi:MAG: hypothetical protein OXU86_06030, partial [Thaumarchaeota archaeon]|nr:hypothetical protein [Nitrososphaerota archaeon]